MGISIWQLLIILVIVIVLFGTKKLRNIGGDLGGAIKNFRSSMREGETDKDKDKDEKNDDVGGKDEQTSSTTAQNTTTSHQVTQENNKGQVIEGQITNKQTHSA